MVSKRKAPKQKERGYLYTFTFGIPYAGGRTGSITVEGESGLLGAVYLFGQSKIVPDMHYYTEKEK